MIGFFAKERKELSPNNISPMQLLDCIFEDQNCVNQKIESGYLDLVKESEFSEYKISLKYLQNREDMVDRVFQLGNKFKQR